jgi:hypothetical protein
VRWAVTYTDPLAARWSGTPLGIALHPVQAYAALAYLTLAIVLLVWLARRRQQGDVAGLWLLGTGVAVYITELWRDPEGRGVLLGGALDGPQIAAILLVLAGGLVLLERNTSAEGRGLPPLRREDRKQVPFGRLRAGFRLRCASLRMTARMGHGASEGPQAKEEPQMPANDEAAHG